MPTPAEPIAAIRLVCAHLYVAAKNIRAGTSGDAASSVHVVADIPDAGPAFPALRAAFKAVATRFESLVRYDISRATSFPPEQLYFSDVRPGLFADDVPATGTSYALGALDKYGWVTLLEHVEQSFALQPQWISTGLPAEATTRATLGTTQATLTMSVDLDGFLEATIGGLSVRWSWTESVAPDGSSAINEELPFPTPASIVLRLPLKAAAVQMGKPFGDYVTLLESSSVPLAPLELHIGADPIGLCEFLVLSVDICAPANDASTNDTDDAGTADAGTADAGTADAGTTDAGTTDADTDDFAGTLSDGLERYSLRLAEPFKDLVMAFPAAVEWIAHFLGDANFHCGDDFPSALENVNLKVAVVLVNNIRWLARNLRAQPDPTAPPAGPDMWAPVAAWSQKYSQPDGPWSVLYFFVQKQGLGQFFGANIEQLHFFFGFNAAAGAFELGMLFAVAVGDEHCLLRLAFRMDRVAAAASAVADLADGQAPPANTLDALPRPGGTIAIVTDELWKPILWPDQDPDEVKLMAARLGNAELGLAVDKVALCWDADLAHYVLSVDGAVDVAVGIVPLAGTLDSPPPDDGSDEAEALVIPFRGLGFALDGTPVMKDVWVTMPETMQAGLPAFDPVFLTLDAFGFGVDRQPAGTGGDRWWVGFSGGLFIKGAGGIGLAVDRLQLANRPPEFELSGVELWLRVPDVLTFGGKIAWGAAALNLPPTANITRCDGFSGMLELSLDAVESLHVLLGFAYVTYATPDDDVTAWSLFGYAQLPVPVPLCPSVGLFSLGAMISENYLPKPKTRGLELTRWLDEGFDGDVINILNTKDYWEIAKGGFSVALSVGLSTIDGYTLQAEALLAYAPGPIIMIGGRAQLLAEFSFLQGLRADLLIVYDNADPGLQASLAVRMLIDAAVTLVEISGTAELYFDFVTPNNWHIHIGTDTNPFIGKAFIFEGRVYFMLDPNGMKLGVTIFYGYGFEFGILSVTARISLQSTLELCWNPEFFVRAAVKIGGELEIRVLAAVVTLEIGASLALSAPDPWLLEGTAYASLTLNLLFWSETFDIEARLKWGTAGAPPDVAFSAIVAPRALAGYGGGHGTTRRTRVELTPTDPGKRLRVPMDGVLGFAFERDIEIQADAGRAFEGWQFVRMNPELAPDAGNVQEFTAQLTAFRIERETAPGHWAPVTDRRLFCWDPVDDVARRRLATRDFERGYRRFRLNDDPTAWLELACPTFYRSGARLAVCPSTPPPRSGSPASALESPILLSWKPFMRDEPRGLEVYLGDALAYQLRYPDLEAELVSDGIFIASQGALFVHADDRLTFKLPVASVSFSFRLVGSAASRVPSADDLFVLLDAHGDPISGLLSRVVQESSPTSTGPVVYRAVLLAHDPADVDAPFSLQAPPDRALVTVVFRAPLGLCAPHGYKTVVVEAYPAAGLAHIHERNIEQLQRRSHLDYQFEYLADDRGKLLWDPGRHRAVFTTSYKTNRGVQAEREHTVAWHVVAPFDTATVEVATGDDQVTEVPLHPFGEGVLRCGPTPPDEVFYRDQDVDITYRVNYVDAMLVRAEKQLLLLMTSSGDSPATAGSVVPYYYLRRDCPLDLSAAELSPCLGPDVIGLDAYERGAFAARPQDAGGWTGLAPRRRYTARAFVLANGEEPTAGLLPGGPSEVYRFDLVTSGLRTVDDWRLLLARAVRRSALSDGAAPGRRAAAMDTLDRVSAAAAFPHPGDAAPGVMLHMGADIFRALAGEPAPEVAGRTLREVEQAFEDLHAGARTALSRARAQEHMALVELLALLGRELGPVDGGEVRAVELGLDTPVPGGDGRVREVIGLLLELPEPLDWSRAAIQVDTLEVRLADGAVIDLLAPGTKYVADFAWLRSLDGTRALLLPRLRSKSVVAVGTGRVATRTPGDADPIRAGVRLGVGANARRIGGFRRSPSDAASRVVELGRGFVRPVFDASVDPGRVASELIVAYTFEAVQLDVFYLSRNYEGAPGAGPYRAIPEYSYRTPRRHPDTGLVGSLTLASEG